jgi:2-polyprenyl-3-methyl-5-hydroxy-6-metoxy-1,4-benzoquinol methylase
MPVLSPIAPWQSLAPPPEFVQRDPPLIEVEEVPSCPVCGDGRYHEHAVGFDYELLTCRNAWRFVRCDACGHVWLNPRPALSALHTIYPPHYYAYNYRQQINPLAVRGKELLDRLKMRHILRYLPTAPQSYCDIGCGDGRFLKVMERRGVRRENNYGLELDERVVQSLTEQGYRVFCERAETCEQIGAGSLDLVTMFHVIEHVDAPAVLARKVADWLAPGGVFAVETPNLDSLDARWFGERHWGGYHIPRHWSLFTPASLARLLEEAGLEVIGLKYQTGHSFWMYSLHHRLRYGARPHPRLAKWFNPLRGLPMLMLFTAFDRLRAALGFRTSSMLMMARRPSVNAP